MVSDRSIQTENHLFFRIFFSLSLSFFMKPPTHKKSCPSTFRWNMVRLDSLFHDHLGNTLNGLINKNVPFIYWSVSDLILRVFDNVQQRITGRLVPEESATVCPMINIKSEVLPVVLWRRMMPGILNYSWHPGCNSTFYHFLGYMWYHCNDINKGYKPQWVFKLK